MPALPSSLLEPLWVQVAALLPTRQVHHPLGAVPAPANRRDNGLLAATLDAAAILTATAIGPLPGTPTVHLDAGYDYQACREVLAVLLDEVPAVLTPSRRRRCRPGKVDADKVYDHAANRAYLRRRGITPRIARRGVESSNRLGRHRWRIERTLSWLSCYRRLGVRWDRDSEQWFAFVLLACALVCFKWL